MGGQGQGLCDGDIWVWNLKNENEEVQPAFSEQKGPERGWGWFMWRQWEVTVNRAQESGNRWPVRAEGQQVPDQGGLWGTRSRDWILFWFRKRSLEGFKQWKCVIQSVLQMDSPSWLLCGRLRWIEDSQVWEQWPPMGVLHQSRRKNTRALTSLWSWKFVRRSWIHNLLWSKSWQDLLWSEYKGKERRSCFFSDGKFNTCSE